MEVVHILKFWDTHAYGGERVNIGGAILSMCKGHVTNQEAAW